MAVQHSRRRTVGATNGVSLTVLGGLALRRLNVQLKAAGRTDLMDELRAGVNKAVQPVRKDIVDDVPQYMPSGYAPVLSKSLRFRTTQRRGASSFTVSMSTVGEGSRTRRDIRSLDKGILRHPTFGRHHYRKWRYVGNEKVRIPGRGQPIDAPWVSQRIKPRFWTDPAERGKDAAIKRAAEAMRAVAGRITA